MEGAASIHPLIPYNGRNWRIKEGVSIHPLLPQKWQKWGNGRGCLEPFVTTKIFAEIREWKELPRATFCYHKMLDMEEGKGLLRSIL
jgi:hypothetical protein